jgi:hypothetical protein
MTDHRDQALAYKDHRFLDHLLNGGDENHYSITFKVLAELSEYFVQALCKFSLTNFRSLTLIQTFGSVRDDCANINSLDQQNS